MGGFSVFFPSHWQYQFLFPKIIIESCIFFLMIFVCFLKRLLECVSSAAFIWPTFIITKQIPKLWNPLMRIICLKCYGLDIFFLIKIDGTCLFELITMFVQ